MLYAFNPLPSEIQKNNIKILQRATVITLILDITPLPPGNNLIAVNKYYYYYYYILRYSNLFMPLI